MSDADKAKPVKRRRNATLQLSNATNTPDLTPLEPKEEAARRVLRTALFSLREMTGREVRLVDDVHFEFGAVLWEKEGNDAVPQG